MLSTGQELEPFNKGPFAREFFADQLWRTGREVFNGIEISLPITSVKNQPGIARYRKMTTSLLVELQQATPILTAFPNLQVCLQARATVARIMGLFLQNIAVDFSYRGRDHTVFLNHQGDFTPAIFAHELGHHVNSYFSEQDWLDFLDKQKWFVEEEESGKRRAVSLENLQILSQEDDPTKPPEHDWIIFNPVYDEYARDWIRGMERRHATPNEMVAEIFAENYREILEYARGFRGTDQQRQRRTVKYLLSKIPAF